MYPKGRQNTQFGLVFCLKMYTLLSRKKAWMQNHITKASSFSREHVL